MAYEQLAKVHLLDALYHIDRAYDYRVPEPLLGEVQTGDFVLVPFGGGNRRLIGLVIEMVQEPIKTNGFQYKPILSTLDRALQLNPEMIGLCRYLKEHTFCTIGEAVKSILPPCAFSKWEERYSRTDKPVRPDMKGRTLSVLNKIEEGVDALSGLRALFGAGIVRELETLVQDGFLTHTLLQKEQNRVYVKRYYLNLPKEELFFAIQSKKIRNEKQIQVLQFLLEQEGLTEQELKNAGLSLSSVKTLLKKEYLRVEQTALIRNPYAVTEDPKPQKVVLNAQQAQAVEQLKELLRSHHAKAALLHGVTGSGKTQVIRAAIDEVLANHRQVILMVPEIALTPQTLRIFLACYGNRAAVLHSGLSDGERYDAWRRMKAGEVDLCIGTRSAVFAPFDRLGMIVMDEEQEHTYKSDSDPKFHARDVARYRCAHQQALLLLASATPSLESYYKAKKGAYTLIRMKNRYGGACLPQPYIVDLRTDTREANLAPVGSVLQDALIQTKADGNQAILFLNRRGYHSFLTCPDCGEVVLCPHCSVSLTHHKGNGGSLRCHYCGYRTAIPTACPGCKKEHLTFFGAGTQQAEEYLQTILPTASVLRMDADTTVSKFSYDEMLEQFRCGKADVLLGTQMVAKGHDFPNVTLVGVLQADQSLYLDDFRSNERTFSLLTQVIGRAGRATQNGRAYIQTYHPDHPVLQLACTQDYEAFYEQEIALRKATVFPPFCDLVTLTCTGKAEVEVMEVCRHLFAYMKELLEKEYKEVKVILYGPMEATLYKLNDRYRMRFVIKCKMNALTRKWMHLVLIRAGELTGKVAVSVDVNPNHA